MPTGTILLLGAFAGLTIYLGLPFAFLKQAPPSLKAFASMLATGVLIFLLYDVIGKASKPIDETLAQVRAQSSSGGTLLLDLFLFVFGLGLGLLGLVYFHKHVTRRLRASTPAPADGSPPVVLSSQRALAGVSAQAHATTETPASTMLTPARATSVVATTPGGELTPQTLVLIIATGIGLHNFAEGLAIGQSAAVGALQLAAVLIIGFGLHNMTEGFGIAGPLTGQSVSWKFIVLVGLIGGGPTFLGTAVGIAFHSPQLFLFCLALAAGAILYVVAELLGVARRFKSPEIVMWGLLVGFLLGYATDLVVTFAGA
jgi:ZIP family zinc transporter